MNVGLEPVSRTLYCNGYFQGSAVGLSTNISIYRASPACITSGDGPELLFRPKKRQPEGRHNDNHIERLDRWMYKPTFTRCRIETRACSTSCTTRCCSHYLSCSRIQHRRADWRPALVVDRVIRPGRHCRTVRRIGPGALLTVPASNHLPDTTSTTSNTTVPDVSWRGCLIRCATVQADNKNDRKKCLIRA